MGASGWAYSVAYRPDVGEALEALRREAFEMGDYFPMSVNPDYAAATGMTPLTSAPAGIDALVEMQDGEGTHSIIDITGGISAEPEPGTASPLTDEQLEELFGTRTPGCEQVEEWLGSGGWYELRDRWEALFVVCHRDGTPHEIHFAGFSGD